MPDDGFLVLASAPYDGIGVDRARAVLKAGFMADFAAEGIRREPSQLAEEMFTRTMVLNWATRTLESVTGEPWRATGTYGRLHRSHHTG